MKKVHLVLVVTLVLLGSAPMYEGLAAERSENQTRLLFPFVSNQGGFDTGIAIANTTADPFGTTEMEGTCTIHYFGATSGGGPLPPQTTAVIPAGGMVTFVISGGGVPGSAHSAAGFQGYIIAVCDFPLAHGFYMVSDLVLKTATSGQALVLSSKRKTSVVESRGQ